MSLIKQHRYLDAIRYKAANGNDTWMVLGGTSAWPNPSNPPDIDEEATDVAEKFVAIKAEVKWLVENEGGTILFTDAAGNNRKFLELATAAEVIAAKTSLVLIEATVSGALLTASSFRIIGIFTGLVPASGYEGETVIEAGNVEDWGYLESLRHRKAYTVDTESNYRLRQFFQY